MYTYIDIQPAALDVSLVVCFVVWASRFFHDEKGGLSDARCAAILSVIVYLNHFIDGNWVTFVALCLCIEVGLRLLDYASKSIIEKFHIRSEIIEQPPGSPDVSFKPFIFPCQTSHSRMFPKTHSFSYSYLMVGVPVGWQGSIGSMISADLDHIPQLGSGQPLKLQRAWFSVEAADHLERGNVHLGLRGKLHKYLKSIGERPEDYPFVYLVTAPRFLGYVSNPVSFWYLYDQERQLKAMVLEVNNTFDERRSYFSKDTDDKSGKSSPTNEFPIEAEKPKQNCSPINSPFKYRNTWQKDFHVSPFNSRKGTYSLSAYDPFNPGLTSVNSIYNTIVLNSSKAYAKLVARVYSTQPPIDPLIMNLWAKIRFLIAWWWVGFATFPRTVKEAGRLFFTRKLHVWFRPEVGRETIGRKETDRER